MPLAGITCHQFYEAFPTRFCFEEMKPTQRSQFRSFTIHYLTKSSQCKQTDVLCSSEQAVLFKTSKIYKITALYNRIPALS